MSTYHYLDRDVHVYIQVDAYMIKMHVWIDARMGTYGYLWIHVYIGAFTYRPKTQSSGGTATH